MTYNGKEYLCRPCLEKSRTVALTSSPGRKFRQEEEEDKENVESPLRGATGHTQTSSAAPRPQQILLNTPDSDYSTDIKDYTSDGHDLDRRSPLSPISMTSGYKSDASYDHADSRGYLVPGHQHFMHYRSVSPAVSAVSHSSHKSKDSTGSVISASRGEPNFGRFFQTSYLEKKDDFKRGPSLNPVERPALHYHRPEGFSYRKVRTDIKKPSKKEYLRSAVASSFLPHRRNSEPYRPIKSQEPIQLSKLPDAHRSESSRPLPIERDDFPAPPAAAAAYPELLREHRYSRRSRAGSLSNELDSDPNNELDDNEDEGKADPKVEKEIQELSKMSDSGAAMMILEGLKKKKQEPVNLDPRSASRTPSASFEPPFRTRYESSIFASASRDLELRAHLPSLDNTFSEPKYRTCSTPVAQFLAPRPGYSLRCGTSDSRDGFILDSDGYFLGSYYHPRRPDSSAAVLERSGYYCSQSDLEEYDPTTGLRRNTRLRSSVIPDGRVTPISLSGHRRKSVPNIFRVEEPLKVYAYDDLRLSNCRRPPGLDNDHLEQYLSKDEFEGLFRMTQEDFYSLAEWKRNDIKRRIELF